MLLFTEMKQPICLKSFTSSRTFRITLIFLVLCIFSCSSLVLVGCVLVGCVLVGCVLVGCILRPIVYAVLPTMSAFNMPMDVKRRQTSTVKSVSSSPAISPYETYWSTTGYQSPVADDQSGEMTHLCHTPVLTWNHSLCYPSCLTQHWLSACISVTILITFGLKPHGCWTDDWYYGMPFQS